MIILANDLLRITTFGLYNNLIRMVNVFHARCTASDGLLDQHSVGGGLWEHIYVGKVLAYQSVTCSYQTVRVEKMDANYNVLDSADVPLLPGHAAVGTAVGDAMPPHACFTIKQTRPAGMRRHGFKHYSGVIENNQNLGLLSITATLRASIEAAHFGVFKGGAFVAGVWTPNNANTLEFVQVSRVAGGLPMSAVQVGAFSGATMSPYVTSANSRKYGHGV